MATDICSPKKFDEALEKHDFSVFLCGSIEMGKAEDWQKAFTDALSEHENVVLLNPRRAKGEWDSSWVQSIDNPQFREQVEWELEGLEKVDLIICFLQPETQSPISLLELGFYAAKDPAKVVVCCPEGFWRKGNVDIVCNRYGIEQVDDINGLIDYTKTRLGKV